MKFEYTVKEVQNHIESLKHYTEVTFEKEIKDDCIYFNAKNKGGEEVSIRADVDSEKEVPVNEWFYYECCEKYDWSVIN